MCATLHLLHFPFLLLPFKWRVELAYDTEPEKFFQLPKWGDACTWSFPCPNKPHPCARVWGGIFSHLYMALRGIYTHTHTLTHTHIHVVYEGGNLAWGHLETKPPPTPVCNLDFISPYTVFLRFLIWISGRVHCFETNLNTFRTDFQNSFFFSLHKFCS